MYKTISEPLRARTHSYDGHTSLLYKTEPHRARTHSYDGHTSLLYKTVSEPLRAWTHSYDESHSDDTCGHGCDEFDTLLSQLDVPLLTEHMTH